MNEKIKQLLDAGFSIKIKKENSVYIVEFESEIILTRIENKRNVHFEENLKEFLKRGKNGKN